MAREVFAVMIFARSENPNDLNLNDFNTVFSVLVDNKHKFTVKFTEGKYWNYKESVFSAETMLNEMYELLADTDCNSACKWPEENSIHKFNIMDMIRLERLLTR